MKDKEKKFEGSYTRVVSVMCITYVVVFCYFSIIGVDKPYLNAVVPTLGFNLSTWSLSCIKMVWMKLNDNPNEKKQSFENITYDV